MILIKGITAFMLEEKLRSLFQGRSSDPWEMAEALAGYGWEMIVINGIAGSIFMTTAAVPRLFLLIPAKAVNPVLMSFYRRFSGCLSHKIQSI